MKRLIVLSGAVIAVVLSGCVMGNNLLTAEQMRRGVAEKSICLNVFLMYEDSNFILNSGKFLLRTVCFFPTLGISEVLIDVNSREVFREVRLEAGERYLAERRRCAEDARQRLKETYDRLIGTDKAALLAANGPPADTFTDGKGGEIYIYENKSVPVKPLGVISPALNNDLNTLMVKKILFYFDQSGKLYKWELK